MQFSVSGFWTFGGPSTGTCNFHEIVEGVVLQWGVVVHQKVRIQGQSFDQVSDSWKLKFPSQFSSCRGLFGCWGQDIKSHISMVCPG